MGLVDTHEVIIDLPIRDSDDERCRAALYVAGHSAGRDDCRLLLEALGLIDYPKSGVSAERRRKQGR
jgi:hypothetical protein